jgi:hypothetical protein
MGMRAMVMFLFEWRVIVWVTPVPNPSNPHSAVSYPNNSSFGRSPRIPPLLPHHFTIQSGVIYRHSQFIIHQTFWVNFLAKKKEFRPLFSIFDVPLTIFDPK